MFNSFQIDRFRLNINWLHIVCSNKKITIKLKKKLIPIEQKNPSITNKKNRLILHKTTTKKTTKIDKPHFRDSMHGVISSTFQYSGHFLPVLMMIAFI